jgi:hypothetical protein
MFMNEFPVSAPKVKGLLRPLAQRSAIDPFIVMDVMGEVNARESSGHHVIHMEGWPSRDSCAKGRARTRPGGA